MKNGCQEAQNSFSWTIDAGIGTIFVIEMGRPPKLDWQKRASEAYARLQKTAHGRREKALQSLVKGAGEAGNEKGGNSLTRANSLRREIRAWRFLEECRKRSPWLRNALSGHPFSTIELLARWHGVDEEAAFVEAEKVARGERPPETLAEALKAARKDSKDGQTTFAERASIEEGVFSTLNGMLRGDVYRVDKQGKDAGIDFLYQQKVELPPEDVKKGLPTIAAIVVGPYGTVGFYSARKNQWIHRLFSQSLLYHRTFLILTSHEPVDDYRRGIDDFLRAIPDWREFKPTVDLLYIPLPESPIDKILGSISFLG